MKLTFRILLFFSIISLSMGCNMTNKPQNKDSLVPVSQSLQIAGAIGEIEAELQIPKLEANEKCPLIILMHGIFSDKNDPLITEFANQLQENKIATIRFDFNGHGESDGEFIDMTVPLEVKDARAIYNYCRQLDFVSDISLLGHSQGGVVASLLGGELQDSIKSIVLLAPAAVLEDEAKKGTTLGVRFDPNNIPEFINVYNHKIGKDYLQSAQKLDIYEKAGSYTGPVCIIHGQSDRTVPFSYSEKYHKKYNDNILYLIEGENHMFSIKTNLAVNNAINFLKEQ